MRDKKAGPQSGVRAQTAILRTLVDELAREDREPDVAEELRSQAIEESARLVSAIQALPRGSPRPPGLQATAGAPSGWIAPVLVPVLFLTGETAPERVAAGFSAGGTTYLVKPLDLELLEEELGRALAGPSV